ETADSAAFRGHGRAAPRRPRGQRRRSAADPRHRRPLSRTGAALCSWCVPSAVGTLIRAATVRERLFPPLCWLSDCSGAKSPAAAVFHEKTISVLTGFVV